MYLGSEEFLKTVTLTYLEEVLYHDKMLSLAGAFNWFYTPIPEGCVYQYSRVTYWQARCWDKIPLNETDREWLTCLYTYIKLTRK